MALTRISNQSLTSVTALPAAISTGKVLQVVNQRFTNYVTSTSNTYADTGLTASITPSSASNKVLITISLSSGFSGTGGNINAQLLRDSTTVETYSRLSFGSSSHINVQGCYMFLDTPSSTNSLTYKLQWKVDASTARINDHNGSNNPSSTITLMEIAG